MSEPKKENFKVMPKTRAAWGALPEHGKLVGDLFLAMKSPINLESCQPAFTDAHLVEFLEKKPKYGMVINFCMKEFYDPVKIKDAGVKYVHLPTPCYEDTIPLDEHYEEFEKVVEKFRSKNPEKKIIIHSTLGLNRCAFYMAEYFHETQKKDRFETIKEFLHERKPGFLRLNTFAAYLKSHGGLKRRHYELMLNMILKADEMPAKFDILSYY